MTPTRTPSYDELRSCLQFVTQTARGSADASHLSPQQLCTVLQHIALAGEDLLGVPRCTPATTPTEGGPQ